MMAKKSFASGRVKDAQAYARELLVLAPKFETNWNYGNAVHDGNMILGRIALSEGRVDEAKRLLLEAGNTPGSPQLNTFGPNMSLAKDLLEKGEQNAVLDYFELCRKFWKNEDGRLDKWTERVKAGKLPEFGASLLH